MWHEQQKAEHQECLCEYEEEICKWEEELKFECEELEHKYEELTCEPPPPVPADAPLPPSPTYETTARHQLIPAPYVITQSCPPPWPNKKQNWNQQWFNNFRDTPARPTARP